MYHSTPGSTHSTSWPLPSVLKVILHVLVVGELLIFFMLRYTQSTSCVMQLNSVSLTDTVVQTHPLHILAINQLLECHRVHH